MTGNLGILGHPSSVSDPNIFFVNSIRKVQVRTGVRQVIFLPKVKAFW